MCPFAGGAEPGYCMKTSGVLSNGEIKRILDSEDVNPVLDKEAGVKYISWRNQWYEPVANTRKSTTANVTAQGVI
jgi:chitinase